MSDRGAQGSRGNDELRAVVRERPPWPALQEKAIGRRARQPGEKAGLLARMEKEGGMNCGRQKFCKKHISLFETERFSTGMEEGLWTSQPQKKES